MLPKVFADRILADERMKVCNTCPDRGSIAGAAICKNCGCLLTAKVKLERARCPMNKWPIPPK